MIRRGVVKSRGHRYTTLKPTKKEALAWEAQKKAELSSLKEKETVTDYWTLCNKYLDYCERFTVKTYKEKKALCKRSIPFFQPDTPAIEITPGKVLDYLNIQAKERSANAYNKDRKNLLAMFGWGVKFLGLENNPVLMIDRLPHDRKPQYTPTQEDVLKLLAAAKPEEKVFLNAYLQTGARRSEIYRWTWTEDINFEKREVRLGTRKTRDGSMEYEWLPMSSTLHDNLWWWWNNRPVKKSPYVFVNLDKRSPYYGKPYVERKKFMRSVCKRAGIKPFGFHAMRRYVASVLADTHKISAKTIQRILRHKSVTTTERYIQNINRDLTATMELLNGHSEKSTRERDTKTR